MNRCPACAQDQLVELVALGEIPVAAGLTFDTPELARASATGRMSLHRCVHCGHVVNVDFQPELVHFDASYEAALFHSPTYTAYALSVVDRLVAAYGLAGKGVLEIASGDPTLIDRFNALGANASGVPELPTGEEQVELVMARFVLEHLADPEALLRQLRGISRRVFIEVPDAGYDLATAGWDCIYPHVGYFGSASLATLAARTGWTVASSGTAFHDQYLWMELEARDEPGGWFAQGDRSRVEGFPARYAEAQALWAQRLEAQPGAVVWGAGTRGTMFCNRIDPDAKLLAGVVDRNPGKHGRYLPATGHRVLAPQELVELQPSLVILTNPAYRDEIAAELAGMGVTAEVLVA